MFYRRPIIYLTLHELCNCVQPAKHVTTVQNLRGGGGGAKIFGSRSRLSTKNLKLKLSQQILRERNWWFWHKLAYKRFPPPPQNVGGICLLPLVFYAYVASNDALTHVSNIFQITLLVWLYVTLPNPGPMNKQRMTVGSYENRRVWQSSTQLPTDGDHGVLFCTLRFCERCMGVD